MSERARPPVSWLLVEPGWRVRASDGEEVGTVAEVQGAADDDIFHGLTVSTGLLSANRFVAASLVAGIVEGEVTLTVPAEAAGTLPEARPSA